MSTGTDAARSAVYGLLAAPLHNPGPDQAAAVAAGEWAAELSGALSRLGVGWRPPLPLPPEELAEAYYQAFGRPRGALRPIESVYKPWTSDPTAELALARSRGWLGGDPAAHLRDLYQAVGITTPRALAHAPDHLALELEFMAVLVEHGTVAQQRLFLQQHLDWLPDLVAAAEALAVPAFYRDLLNLTAGFVGWDAGYLRRIAAGT